MPAIDLQFLTGHDDDGRLRVGALEAGRKVAAILSVVESLPAVGSAGEGVPGGGAAGVNGRAIGEVGDLTPARWAEARRGEGGLV